jgi:TRAP-type mannitol/chloroaromatic compound transport system permease small subunit
MIPVVHQIFDVFVLFVGVVVGFLLLLLVLVVDYNIVVIFVFLLPLFLIRHF